MMTKIIKKLSKVEEKLVKIYGSSHAVQEESSNLHQEIAPRKIPRTIYG